MDPPVSMWKRITFVEPIVFLIMFSYSLSDSVITDAIVYKTCRKIMNESAGSANNNCTILYNNSSSDAAKALQEIVQPHIATLLTLKSSIETLFPTILCLFLGPWSDSNGRKPLLIVPFIGSITYYTLYAVISNFPDADAHWFLLPSTISSLLGGFPAILLTSFCYVADITDSQNRAWRLGFLDFVLFGGQLVGWLVSPVLFRRFGYCVVFAISALSCCLGLLYSYFLLMETVYIISRSVKSIIDVRLIRELYNTVARKRDGFDRCLTWCCLVIIALHDDMMQGTATIIYLFSKRFGWSLLDFSMYSMVHLSVTMAGMMLLVKVIAPLLKLPDTMSILIASLSNGGSSIVKAFAQKPWHMYLSTGVGLFSLTPASLVRSIISKTISQKDVGKAFAVTTTMEKIGPFVTTPLFVFVYTNFIKTYPCPVWFLPAGFCVIIVILAIVVEHRWRILRHKQSETES